MRNRIYLLLLLALALSFALVMSFGFAEEEEEETTKTIVPKDISDAELMFMHPASVDNRNLDIDPIEALNRTGRPVDVDIEEYRLKVDGLVENPLELSYEELLARPAISKVVLLICPGFFADNAKWTGTPLKDILEEAKIKEEAKYITFYGTDGYSSTFSLDEILNAEGDILLVYKVNDQTLPREHGFPLRLVAEYFYGGKWVKWLERIGLAD